MVKFWMPVTKRDCMFMHALEVDHQIIVLFLFIVVWLALLQGKRAGENSPLYRTSLRTTT